MASPIMPFAFEKNIYFIKASRRAVAKTSIQSLLKAYIPDKTVSPQNFCKLYLTTTNLSQYALNHKPEEFGIVHRSRLEYFRHLMRKMGDDHHHHHSFEGLAMIDAVQRLGIDHHFREEIEEVLHKHYLMSSIDGDLHGVALRFRLLRQQGYHVPAGVFEKFKDSKGRFDNKLKKDMKGLMELYEASQLGVEGEDILDEAGEFSGQILKVLEPLLNHHQDNTVGNTLKHPHHKNISRFMARNFLQSSQEANRWIHVLQELARLDFNMVQSLHQNELHQVSKWWEELGLRKELNFVRDQPLKWYAWCLACVQDPSLSQERVELTKPVAMIYVIDDIFDLKGTLHELTLFTEAIVRWDYSIVEQLPEYMKICFKALDDITSEISHKVKKSRGWNPVNSLRKAWGSLCRAFLVEAKWFASGKLPKAEEYLENGIISTGVHVALVHLFFLLGQNLTKETVDQIDNNPGIISSTATILRLWDDLGSAEDENQQGYDGSYMECYMMEQGIKEAEQARKHVVQKISDSWKRLNRECLSPNPFSSSAFAKGSLNAARMVPLMYSYDKEHCLPSLHKFINSVLYEPIIL